MSDEIICEVCGTSVLSSRYDRHIKYGHKEKKELKCHICQKDFTSLYNLQYHLAHHLNARNFLCNECPRAYNTAADLAQHGRSHEKKREPHKCEQCGMLFDIRSKFNTHMRIHQEPARKKPRECPICRKMCVCLSSHHRIVHMARTFKCDECDKSFGQKSGLSRHILTVHQNIRSFKCNVTGCKMAFVENFQLKKHMKIHREDSFCSFCDLQLNDVKSHFESVHKNLKHSCKICYKRFEKQQTLCVHMKICSRKIKYFCDLCPCKGFAERLQLKQHLKTHKTNISKDEHSVDNEATTTKCSTKIKEAETDQDHFVAVKEDPDWLLSKTVEVAFVDIKTELLSDNEDQRIDNQNIKFDCIDSDNETGLKNSEQPETADQDCSISNGHFSDDLSTTCSFNTKNRKPTSDIDVQPEPSTTAKHSNHESTSLTLKKVSTQKSHKAGNNSKPKIDQKAQRTCAICQKVFSKQRNLRMHVLAVHNEKSFSCDDCKKNFSFKSARDRHVKVVHLNQREHHCNECQHSFGTKTDLTNHLAYNHSSDPEKKSKYFCETCKKSFISSCSLRRHKKGVHENIKQKQPLDYRCKFCKEAFSNKYQKEKHLAQVHHDGSKLLRTCRMCNLDFKLFDEFKAHIDSHPNYHICLICGLSNRSASDLKTHLEDHKHVEMELRRFNCDFCGHRVFNKIQLKVHMRKHMTQTSFYVCDICGQSYKYIAPFLYHKKVHEGKKDFICSYCGKEFLRKQDLTIHTRSHTLEKPFKCMVCDKRFAAKQILYVHLQTHSATRKSYKCDECGLNFADRKESKRHDETTHPDRCPFWCHLCHQSFKMEHLLKLHRRHKHKTDEQVSNVGIFDVKIIFKEKSLTK